MAGLEELEDRVTALEHNMWGVKGDNGVVTDVRSLSRKLDAWMDAETKRREDLARDEKSKARAINAAAVSSVIALIGVIVTLVVVLQGVA